MKYLFLLLFISCNSHKISDLEVVPHVDLSKYEGQWYEIARYENEFQENCLGTRAIYTQVDNKIAVHNECQTKNGTLESAHGTAFVVDQETNAKLKVSFVPLLQDWGLFAGDYWIIELDKNYDYVVVGHPERKYLWILSRSSEMKNETLEGILERLKNSYKYDTEKVKISPQWVDQYKSR